MECTIVCDCGTELAVNETSAHPECPSCEASYAVTLTTIRQPKTATPHETGAHD